jgi:hypothetical protein
MSRSRDGRSQLFLYALLFTKSFHMVTLLYIHITLLFGKHTWVNHLQFSPHASQLYVLCLKMISWNVSLSYSFDM